MSLDFVILGEAGAPVETVAFVMKDFLHITGGARQLRLRILSAMNDYYADCVVNANDVDELANECEALQKEGLDLENPEVLSSLVELCKSAKAKGACIEVLAD